MHKERVTGQPVPQHEDLGPLLNQHRLGPELEKKRDLKQEIVFFHGPRKESLRS